MWHRDDPPEFSGKNDGFKITIILRLKQQLTNFFLYSEIRLLYLQTDKNSFFSINQKGPQMFAVVDIAGQQFKVLESEKHYVPRLNAEPDSEVVFDNVLLYSDDAGVKVGKPYVDGLKVTAKVLSHLKDEKVIVYKKKRRKNYEKMNGHRQHLTRIEIIKIG